MMIELHGIYLTLKKWRANPELSRKVVSVFSADKSRDKADIPFTEQEIVRMKERLKEKAPTSDYTVFPEDRS